LFDQSASLFIIEDQAGTDLFTLNKSGDITVNSCAGCGSGSLPVVDTTSIVKGSVDDTKELRFEVDGFTTLFTRILTPQDASYTIAGTNLIGQVFTVTQIFDGNILPANDGVEDIGVSGTAWGDIWFSGEISGGGTVGMNWVPDGDGTRDSATSANSWNAVYTEGLNVQEADDTTLIELSNTTASATQFRLNDPGGTRRMNIGFFGAGDNDVAVSLLGPTNADNIAITSAGNGGVAALQIDSNDVVRKRLGAIASSCTPDSTWDANEQNCLTAFVLTINFILDSMRATGGHGLIAD
ncbi:hypothetical protein LCGC14_3118240, partial [marine sediment metagenome]